MWMKLPIEELITIMVKYTFKDSITQIQRNIDHNLKVKQIYPLHKQSAYSFYVFKEYSRITHAEF